AKLVETPVHACQIVFGPGLGGDELPIALDQRAAPRTAPRVLAHRMLRCQLQHLGDRFGIDAAHFVHVYPAFPSPASAAARSFRRARCSSPRAPVEFESAIVRVISSTGNRSKTLNHSAS